MTPKCPDCDGKLEKIQGTWWCDRCELEWEPEQLEQEEEND